MLHVINEATVTKLRNRSITFVFGVTEALFKCAKQLRRRPRLASIVDIEAYEYQFLFRLQEEGLYRLLFFIDEESYSRRFTSGGCGTTLPILAFSALRKAWNRRCFLLRREKSKLPVSH